MNTDCLHVFVWVLLPSRQLYFHGRAVPGRLFLHGNGRGSDAVWPWKLLPAGLNGDNAVRGRLLRFAGGPHVHYKHVRGPLRVHQRLLLPSGLICVDGEFVPSGLLLHGRRAAVLHVQPRVLLRYG